MKKIGFFTSIGLLLAIFFLGCQSRGVSASNDEKRAWSDSVVYYTEQVRQGDREAYLNLARSYHDEKESVELRSLRMLSVALAAEKRGTLGTVQYVFEPLPDDDSVKKLYNVVKLISEGQYKEAVTHGDEFEKIGLPRKLIDAFVLMDQWKCDEVAPMFDSLAEQGGAIARVCSAYIVSEKDSSDIESLLMVADDFPLFYNRIARRYVEKGNHAQAAAYYLKADSCACLDKDGILFLLEYDESLSSSSEKKITSGEIERLKNLAKDL